MRVFVLQRSRRIHRLIFSKFLVTTGLGSRNELHLNSNTARSFSHRRQCIKMGVVADLTLILQSSNVPGELWQWMAVT